MASDLQPFNVRLSSELIEQLNRRAEERGVSTADLVREALVAATSLAEQKRREPDQLLIEVLRTRALLRRFIEQQTDEAKADALVANAHEDVELYLKNEEQP